jgi:hypothetical protein
VLRLRSEPTVVQVGKWCLHKHMGIYVREV